MSTAATVGFYSLSQLASRHETERQKGYIGIFPWSERKIRQMWKQGKFPKPVVMGGKNIWSKQVIHEFIDSLKLKGAIVNA